MENTTRLVRVYERRGEELMSSVDDPWKWMSRSRHHPPMNFLLSYSYYNRYRGWRNNIRAKKTKGSHSTSWSSRESRVNNE